MDNVCGVMEFHSNREQAPMSKDSLSQPVSNLYPQHNQFCSVPSSMEEEWNWHISQGQV